MHEELQLIMKTAMTKFTDKTGILIQGIKGKFDSQGNLINNETKNQLAIFINALVK
nr:hypothetical protein [uncultured Draconibacterium sp.]